MKNSPVTDIVPNALLAEMASLRKSAKPWQPHQYQQRGVKSMLSNAQYGLLYDPGMGKSSTTLASLKVLLAKKLVKRALIVAPLKPVYEVWPQELSTWSDFADMRCAILHGPKKEQVLQSLTTAHQITLINQEGFAWLCESKKRLELLGADALVIDESSKWKSSQSVRFQALRKVLHLFKRRYILTGSPRPRNYEDLFSQIYILDRGVALGNYVSHYRHEFFYQTGYMMREWALLPGKEAIINRRIAPMVLRLDAKDYLKLPKDPERLHQVELPPQARAIYDQLESSFISEVFDQPMASVAAKRSKLCQMANGAVYIDNNPDDDFKGLRKWQPIHDAKLTALRDLYDELQGEPLMISIGYHHDVDRVRQMLGFDVPCLNGKTTIKQSKEYITKWNKGELPAFMLHPASASHGLNLQGSACRHVAMFDLPDDYDLYDQIFKRVWRQGNKAAFVMRHLFVCRATVDVPKLANLRRKGTGQRAFLDAMREYAEKRRHG